MTNSAWEQVSSSSLSMVAYDEQKRRLWIKFVKGGRRGNRGYYSDVPREVYEALMAASSHGRYHYHHIRSVYNWTYQ